MNKKLKDFHRQPITKELEKRLKNNALTDYQRLNLVRILLVINRKLPSLSSILADLTWKPSKCCYCQEQFVPQEFQQKKYRLFEMILRSEMLVMIFHKECFVKFNQDTKKAEEQIKNESIDR